jgi:tRNA 2-thiocytidine biosynthesis protein TtcA
LTLGHHADDAIESMLMSQMFNRVVWTQCPVVEAKDGKITVIRPLILTFEQQMKDYSKIIGFPIIKCNCPFEGDPKHKRFVVKQMVNGMVAENTNCRNNLLKTVQEVFEIVNEKRKNN